LAQASIRLISSWVAFLAKFDKCCDAAAADIASPHECRMLLALNQPECQTLSANQLANALMVRPTDIYSVLENLVEHDLVESYDEVISLADPAEEDETIIEFTAPGKAISSKSMPWHITDEGKQKALAFEAAVSDVLAQLDASLQEPDLAALKKMIFDILVRPGSFYAQSNELIRNPEALTANHRLVASAATLKAIDTCTKSNLSLSVTDFRFLLELYPQHRGAEKSLRAKEIVNYLRVGRSYVSVTADRLEKEGLLMRIPDPDDARGVLFQLTSEGKLAVRETADDLSVLYAGLFGSTDDVLMRSERMLSAALKTIDDYLVTHS